MSKSAKALQILQSLSDATAEIVSRTAPSVVTVSNRMGMGSGVVWSPDGYIVTCSHVVRRHAILRVSIGEGKTYEAKVIGQDSYSDIALLKIEEKGLKPIKLGDSDSLKVGQFVIAMANPFNRKPSATSGIVTTVSTSLKTWSGMMDNVIVTDARLNPGYSGGPLLDVSGRMIGLNLAYVWSRGIAVPISKVKHVVESLISEGRVKRAYLGIVSNTIALPQEIAEQSEINQDSGVMVYSVEAGSPAKKAGLAIGDIIVKFNEKPATSIYELPNLLTDELIGKETKLKILRGERLSELTITPIAAGSES